MSGEMGPCQEGEGCRLPGIGINPQRRLSNQDREGGEFLPDGTDQGRIPRTSSGEDHLVHSLRREMVSVGAPDRLRGKSHKGCKQVIPLPGRLR